MISLLINVSKNALAKKCLILLVIIVPIFAFLIRGALLLDPDFGWHIKMGEYVAQYGIPSTDPFSYTMASFPFVDHEWGTNIALYFLYKYFGWNFLSIAYTIIAFCAIFISLQFKNKSISLFIAGFLFLLVAGAILPYFGIRPQIQSWLFLSILNFILFYKNIWKKWKYCIPFLFLLWVNTHGSFGAGIVVLFFVIGLRTFRLRSISISDIFVCLSSFLATFLNPYTFHVWREVLQQITDSSIHWTIQEWRSSLLTFNAPFLFLMCISGFLIWKYKNLFLLEEKGLFAALLLQALSATRHVPLWTICAIPLILKGFQFLYKEIKEIPYGKKRFYQMSQWAFLLSTIIFILQSFFTIANGARLNEENFYPQKAIEYLQTHEYQGRVFSEYGWGGYLIWKFPQEKTFIDGRMATWQWKNNPPNEEGYVFKVHQQVVSGEKSYQPVFEKYNVQIVLWPNGEKNGEKTLDPRIEQIEDMLLNLLGKKKYKPLLVQLPEDNWQKIYEDDVSVIYQKPE